MPYDTRAAIEASGRRPPVLVWVDDPVDNFFLQVQGSGRVLLTDGPDSGKTIRVAYADHNGQPYASIGRWLIDRGELSADQASMQNIRAWAQRNPKRVPEMLNANPAVVFFREAVVDPEQGPKGAYGIALAPQRSVAVDAGFVPLGTPVFLATTYPASDRPLQRLVFARTPAPPSAERRGPTWGYGEEAGQQAGRMKQRGQMWLLWPKQGSPARDDSSDRSLRGRHRRPVDRPGVGPARAARGRAGPARLGAGGRSRPLPPARVRDLPGQPAVPGRPGRLGRHAARLTPVQAMEIHGDADGEVHLNAWQAALPQLAWIVESGEIERVLIQAVRLFGIPWIEDRCAGYANGEIQTENGARIRAELFVGADGAASPLREAAGLKRGGAVQGHRTGGAPGRRTAAPGHRRSVVPRRRRAGAAAAAGHVRRRAGVDGLVHARRGRGACWPCRRASRPPRWKDCWRTRPRAGWAS